MEKTNDIGVLVGHQPLNNPAVDAGGLAFYLVRTAKVDDFVECEIRRHAINNGDGFVSPRDVLLQLQIQTDDRTPDEVCRDVMNDTYCQTAGMLEVDGLGVFVYVAGNVAVDKPITSYVDRNNITRYIATPLFSSMVVRLKNVD